MANYQKNTKDIFPHMRKTIFILLLITATIFSAGQKPIKYYIPWVQSNYSTVLNGFILQGDTFRLSAPVNGQILKRINGVWTNTANAASVLDSIVFNPNTGELKGYATGTPFTTTDLDGRYLTIDSLVGYMEIAVYDTAGISEQLVGINATQSMSNKTLIVPTITNYSNANHDHSSVSSGGLINADNVIEGTTNKFSQWLENGTSLYYMAGNVGIGKSNPSEKLDVAGTTQTEILKVLNSITFDGLTLTDIAPGASGNNALVTKGYVDELVLSAGGYTDEQAQDAVGTILDNGGTGDVVFTYDDATPKISGEVENDSHSHTTTTISGLAVADFTSANVSQWTNDAGYLTSGTAAKYIKSVEGVQNDAGDIDIIATGIITVSGNDAANTITIGADSTKYTTPYRTSEMISDSLAALTFVASVDSTVFSTIYRVGEMISDSIDGLSTGTGTVYTEGQGIDITAGVVKMDINSITTTSTPADGTTQFLPWGYSVNGNHNKVSISALSDADFWNAEKLRDFSISTTDPTNGQLLSFNSTTSQWEPKTISTGGSLWTADSYGISFQSGNVSIGIGSITDARFRSYVNASGKYAGLFQNQSSTGYGVYIQAGSNSDSYPSLEIENYSGTDVFKVNGNGKVFANALTNSTKSNVLYYDSSTKEITYGAAPSGGSLSGGTANKVAFWTGASTVSYNSFFHWDDANTRLGLGTTSPAYILHVNDNVKFGSTASDMRKLYFGDGTYVHVGEDGADNRLSLKGSSLAVNINGSTGTSGQVLTASGSGTATWESPSSGGLSGGTTNYIPYWTGTSALGTTSLFWNTTYSSLGIGVTNPYYQLEVANNMKIGTNYGWSSGNDKKLFFGDGNFIWIGEADADDRLKLYSASLAISIGGSVGTSGQVLTSNGTTASWQNSSSGFTNPMTTTGDIIYRSAGASAARLGIGTNGQVLTVSGGVPAWVSKIRTYTLTTASNSVTIDLTNYEDATISINGSANITFTFALTADENGKTGNIKVYYNNQSVVTFTAPSNYSLFIADNIYNSTTNSYTKSVLSKTAGTRSVYSYFIIGSDIYINGTQDYN